MKKEIIACALLLTLAACCVCNIRYLNRLCTQLDDAAAQAEACCAAHDTDSAAEAGPFIPNDPAELIGHVPVDDHYMGAASQI